LEVVVPQQIAVDASGVQAPPPVISESCADCNGPILSISDTQPPTVSCCNGHSGASCRVKYCAIGRFSSRLPEALPFEVPIGDQFCSAMFKVCLIDAAFLFVLFVSCLISHSLSSKSLALLCHFYATSSEHLKCMHCLRESSWLRSLASIMSPSLCTRPQNDFELCLAFFCVPLLGVPQAQAQAPARREEPPEGNFPDFLL
jgi:hypothetical protein